MATLRAVGPSLGVLDLQAPLRDSYERFAQSERRA